MSINLLDLPQELKDNIIKYLDKESALKFILATGITLYSPNRIPSSFYSVKLLSLPFYKVRKVHLYLNIYCKKKIKCKFCQKFVCVCARSRPCACVFDFDDTYRACCVCDFKHCYRCKGVGCEKCCTRYQPYTHKYVYRKDDALLELKFNTSLNLLFTSEYKIIADMYSRQLKFSQLTEKKLTVYYYYNYE